MTNTPPIAAPQPQYPSPRPTVNTMATLSLVFGIISLVANLLLVPTILGIVFGVIALGRSTRLGGRGKAVAGVLLSIVGAIVGITLFSLLVSGIGHAATTAALPAQQPASSAPAASAAAAASPSSVQPSMAASASAAPSKSTPVVSAVYLAALVKAQAYSDEMDMSKKGIYDQLVSSYGEKFPKAAAKYAVAHVKADWDANALAKAKTYEKEESMSPDAIYDQLTSSYGEKFTKSQAEYAVKHLND